MYKFFRSLKKIFAKCFASGTVHTKHRISTVSRLWQPKTIAALYLMLICNHILIENFLKTENGFFQLLTIGSGEIHELTLEKIL